MTASLFNHCHVLGMWGQSGSEKTGGDGQRREEE